MDFYPQLFVLFSNIFFTEHKNVCHFLATFSILPSYEAVLSGGVAFGEMGSGSIRCR